MTDWLPWGGVLMAGTFATLHFVLKSLESRHTGDAALRQARRAFWVTVVTSLLVYAMYLVFDEDWLPYT